MRRVLGVACAAWLLACSSSDRESSGDPSLIPGFDAGPGAVPGAGGSPAGGNADAGGSVGNPPVVVGTPPGKPIDPGKPDEPISIDRCASGGALDQASIDKLLAGGSPSGLRVLYPYDGTVFPRGLKAPLVMWDGVAGASAVYVHIKAGKFEYKGCSAPTEPGRLQIPQEVWDAAGQKTRGKPDPFTIELSVLANGQVTGPIKTQWIIAQATIKGSVYYNSYSSARGIAAGVIGGVVLRIPPGGDAEPYVVSECNGCHSVSANGSRMITQTLGLGARNLDISGGKPQQRSAPTRAAYAALYPDGSRYVRPTLSMEAARSTLTAGLGLVDTASALIATDTGMVIPSAGLPETALMPSFSPSGRLLVYTDTASPNARAIAAVDFDGASNAASNPRMLFDDTSGSTRAGWPFALPDDQAVVFVRGGLDWSGNGAGVGGGLTAVLGPYSELFMVDIDSKQTTLLARAMGYATPADAAAQKTYLPYGAEDIGKAYFPTVSPVAAGGYFWVFFDAVRHYGNQGTLGVPDAQRQLWGTAIEISPSGDYSVDRSNPAFYLPGQEFGTGNHRAFTALDACKMDGDKCTSGIDCCGGFCTLGPVDEFGNQSGTCASTAQCAKTDEKCKTNADCCPLPGQPNTCIGGYCAQIPILL